jgi:autotransporter-associated beta strand protein
MATNGGDNVYPFAMGTTTNTTIVSDRASAGAGIAHPLTTLTTAGLGGGSITFTSGADVTSGTGSISFDQLNLGAGSVQTTTLNPTTATVSIGTVMKSNNAVAQTLELGGTTTGNAITGAISDGVAQVAIVKSNASTWTISGNNTYTGGTTVNGGTLIVGHVNALGTAGLTINNTATTQLQAGLSSPVQLPSLTIAGGATPTAKLDVTNNNMVLHNGSITTTLAQLKSGLNASGTLWAGAGITSSTAAADAAANSNSTVFAVGAIRNVDQNNNLIYSTWPAPPSPDTGATGLATTDVLVKYTYFGDADLNGVVDNTNDYDLWSTGFTNPGLAATNGWLYGDFDFSGIVDNTTDYDLWSTGFAHQSGPLSAGASTASIQSVVQPVPEPSAILMAAGGFAAVSVLVLRRSRPLIH